MFIQSIKKNKYLLMTLLVFIVYIFSFHYKFLDPFVIGTWHGKIGNDFFSIPRSFINLEYGKNIFDTSFFPYGNYATRYFYHPALSILLGSWLSLFPPWVSFYIFVILSMGIILYSAKLMNHLLRQDGKVYLVYGCSTATYLMLWNAQVHVFLMLSMTLIICGLSEEKEGKLFSAQKKIFWGLLISLLSKPIVLTIIPYLLILPSLRKTIFKTILIYALVSLVFLIVPVLNPDGGNIVHWKNIFSQSSKLIINEDIFSVPWIFSALEGGAVNLMYMFKLPMIVALLPLCRFNDLMNLDRHEFVFTGFILVIISYFLSYTAVWEYHYTHLLPIMAVVIWGNNTENKFPILMSIILMSVPGLFGFYQNSEKNELVMKLLMFQKILKVLGVSIIYFIYLKKAYIFCHLAEVDNEN